MSFIPKVAGGLVGMAAGGGKIDPVGAMTGGILGGMMGKGNGGERRPMDERTSTGGYRSGRGASSLSV